MHGRRADLRIARGLPGRVDNLVWALYGYSYLGVSAPPLQHGPRKFLKKPGTRELAVSTSGRQLVRRTVQDPAAAQ